MEVLSCVHLQVTAALSNNGSDQNRRSPMTRAHTHPRICHRNISQVGSWLFLRCDHTEAADERDARLLWIFVFWIKAARNVTKQLCLSVSFGAQLFAELHSFSFALVTQKGQILSMAERLFLAQGARDLIWAKSPSTLPRNSPAHETFYAFTHCFGSNVAHKIYVNLFDRRYVL